MKLVKQDIQHIDTWLKKHGIKYIDIRYELMDHLISEYESIENYPDLESFLKERLAWCKKVAKEKEKSLKSGYLQEIWKQLLGIYKNKKNLFIIVIVVFCYYLLFPFLTLKQFRFALYFPLFSVAAYQIYLLGFKCFNSKKQKEYVSIAGLVSIISVPNFLLYSINVFPDKWLSNVYFLIVYSSLAVIINIAAILAFHKKRKHVVKEYEFLKVYLA